MYLGRDPVGGGRSEDLPGVPAEPVPAPDWMTPDWMTEEEWLARCAARCDEDVPPDLGDEEDWDPEDLAVIMAESDQAADDEAAAEAHIAGQGETAVMAAIASAAMGRRGPGMPGSATVLPGVYSGPGGGFATGQALDVAPGGPVLLGQVECAAGDDDRFGGTSDDELLGIICAAERCEASASAVKHAAAAAQIRRRPAPGCALEGPADMPEAWDEFAADELAHALGQSRRSMDGLLGLAHDLEIKLPGTKALFRDGILSTYKAQIIATACHLLDAGEARAAEALVLGQAARLTPGGLRAAIARAVMKVNAEKARKRRETEARKARVERWAEFSGNAGLAGRELPPVEALAADERIDARARQLRLAGLEGSADELRARAYLDLLLGTDSRPSPAPADVAGGGAAGFTGRVTLTVPLATLEGLADRPGELGGVGPVDPWLARDLASAAGRHPRTTWCVTVTDEQGHAVGHGCARPEPRSHKRRRGKRDRDGPEFAFTPSSRDGPPGGYGTWRLRTGGNGPDLIVSLDPIAPRECDHRFEARGHDPGVKLRHLSQVRHVTCTAPTCRRPASQCDFEHNVPFEAGGRSCLCNGGPKCRHDHRLKQQPGWNVDQLPDGTFRWTTPSGRQYDTEPTRYPV